MSDLFGYILCKCFILATFYGQSTWPISHAKFGLKFEANGLIKRF